ncbi:MAG TPA: flagellar FliJ family protein [Desulfosalsimonadaceae bacterium]|nr:flagellar FliJ family protein [Desulfosalsimonadaceae bacterium]
MKPFQLQTVLDYRKRCEDAEHKELLERMEVRDAHAEERRAAAEEIERLSAELDAAKQDELQVPELLLYEQCIAVKRQEEAEICRKLSAAETAVRQKQAELVRARQERRALELLKEKRQAAQLRKERLQENKFMDEIAVTSYGGSK